MKKTALFAASAALLLFGACQKEGKYNPKEKISQVSEEYSYEHSSYDEYAEEWNTYTESTPKHVSEKWTWDGKKLTQIAYINYDYDSDGNLVPDGQDVMNFTYDGSQLTEINSSHGERMVFTYDGKKLQKAEYFDESTTPVVSYEFEHNGKKISAIIMTMSDVLFKKSPSVNRMERLLLGNIIPQTKSTEKVLNSLRTKATKAATSVRMELTWDGDNVSKITAATPYGNAAMSFTYDDKNNPFKGFVLMFGFYGESETGVEFCNKNNITKSVLSDIEGDTEEENYSYTYDGKWPVTRTIKYSWNEEDFKESQTQTTYFEYE